MEKVRLCGYVCGEEKAQIVEDITVQQLRKALNKGKAGYVGSCMCGCNMWEELRLNLDGTFQVNRIMRTEVPQELKILDKHICAPPIWLELVEDGGKWWLYSTVVRYTFKLTNDNQIEII